MSFNIGSIVNGIANSVMPGVADGGDAATDPPLAHEPAHAQLAGTPNSNPAAGAERQGIIIIGGDVPLHPIAREAAALANINGESTDKDHKDPVEVPNYDPKPAPAPGGRGFSGLLHDIANLGRG